MRPWACSVVVALLLLTGWPDAAGAEQADALGLPANGDFEVVDPRGQPADWEMAGPNTELVAQGTGRHLVVRKASGDFVTWAKQVVDVDPAWRRVRLAARVRAEGLPADAGQGGRLVALVLDGAGRSLGYLKAPQVAQDTAGWLALAEESDLPPGAAKIELMAGNFAATGTVSFDDVVLSVVAVDRALAQPVVGRTWHVSASAAPGGDGSEAAPFVTIQAAADVARAGDTVLIRAGVYRESVRPAHDGTRQGGGSFITFRAAEGQEVVVSGADVVQAHWTPHPQRPGVLQATVPDTFASGFNQAEQLFVDGRMMIEARHPNTPFDSLDPLRAPRLHVRSISDQGPTPQREPRHGWRRLELADSSLQLPDGAANGGRIYLTPREGEGDQGGGWGFALSGVVLEHGAGRLVADLPIGPKGKGPGDHHRYDGGEPYYLAGTLALLDAPGEWLRQGDTIYLMPPPGFDPRHALLEVKRRDLAFDLTGRSYLRLQGLGIFAATVTTDADASPLRGAGGGTHLTDRGRRDVAPSHHVVLEGLRARYVNHFTDQTAWDLGQWVQTSGVIVSGRHHVVRGCVIGHTAGNGLLAIGEGHVVEDNVIHDVNYAGVFAAGICLGMETPNRDLQIRHNTVYGCGFDGITSQLLRSSRRARPAAIHHNRVSDFGWLSRDVGGIKAVGHTPGINGTRWHHNLISDGGAWSIGLYHDFTSDFVVDHNVVWDVATALNLNDGKGHVVEDNTLLGFIRGVSTVKPLERVTLVRNVIAGPPLQHPIRDGREADNVYEAQREGFPGGAAGDWRRAAGGTTAGAVPAEGPALEAGARGVAAVPAGAALAVRRRDDGAPTLQWSTPGAAAPRPQYVERSLRPTPVSYYRVWEVVAELPPQADAWADASPEARWNTPLYRVRPAGGMVSNTARARAAGPVLKLTFEPQHADVSPFRHRLIGTLRDAAGPHGRAADLSPDATPLRVDHHPALCPGDAVAVSLWLMPRRWPGGNRVVLLKGPPDRPTYAVQARGDRLHLMVGDLRAELPLPREGAWTHLAFAADGMTLQWSIDGAPPQPQRRENARVAGIPQGDEPLWIGGPSEAGSPNSRFDGLVDELTVSSGAATPLEPGNAPVPRRE